MEFFTRKRARRYLLAKQGLWPPRSVGGEAGLLEIFENLRCLQFDPIDIVGRNHEIALQARLSGFRRSLLEKALYESRTLVEGWDKQMSIGPIADRSYFASDRREALDHHRFREDGPLSEMLPLVREEIRRRGPLSSLEIDSDEKLDWSWAPARAVRAAMEALWFRGEVVIHHREGSRRYYDFAKKLLPVSALDPPLGDDRAAAGTALRAENRLAAAVGEPPGGAPSWPPPPHAALDDAELFLDWRIARRIGAVGFLMAKSGDGWLGIRAKAAERRACVARLVEREVLVPCRIEGFPEPAYRLKDDGGAFERSAANPSSPRAAVLAPLDNLLWDRAMIRALFGFDYVWEVYKPAAQRRWGYYVLPILYGDRFIARFEPARDREGGRLIVKRWWTEPGVRASKTAAAAVAVALRSLSAANGLTRIAVGPACSDEPLLSAVSPS